MKKNIQRLHLVTQSISLVSIGISMLLLYLITRNNEVILSDLTNDIYNIKINPDQITSIRFVSLLPNIIQFLNIILSAYLYINVDNKKLKIGWIIWVVSSILYTLLLYAPNVVLIDIVIKVLMVVVWVSNVRFVYLIYINYFRRREI